MTDDITAIKNYILYLKNERGLAITLHPYLAENLIVNSELLNFNIHDNPYCVYLKTCKEAHEHCINKQKKVFEKCLKGNFIGVCHAGVKEFVYPISNGENTVGFICVSGYQCETPNPYLKKIANKYLMLKEQLSSTYQNLRPFPAEEMKIHTLISPLLSMLELAYIKRKTNPITPLDFFEKVVRYIKTNYTQEIDSETICRVFNCSRSHLSHLFHAKMNMNLREYINTLRLENAKILLKNSTLNVTEIGYSVGFSDSNYFAKLFKKSFGISPSVYRKQFREANFI